MPVPESLDSIAERISANEKIRSELAARLRFNSGKMEYAETLEKELYYQVKLEEINGSVAAVDAGIAGEELHGFDFLVQRTVGVIFDYSRSRVLSHKYFPSAMPPLEYDVRSGLDSHDVMWHKSLVRLKGELTCATEIINAHSPSFMLLDGSIAPLLSDKPSEDSEMRPLYDEVVAAYKSLYESSWKSGCALLGVIKDSRSKRFIEILGRHAPTEQGFMHTTDTNFLHFLLEAGERTCAFTYSSKPASHQVLKDLGEWSEKILSFYIKPVKEDRPLRVEFLSGQKTFSDIASFAHSLSCVHKAYAYPAILIEADLRAAMQPEDFERAYGTLFSKLGRSSALFRLRRNTRPFR
ncbi:MAG: DNA double-strand break repair nuclease NurA [Candidatus Micrarchaeota archaeon]|nr:DNA double-strand break repair nuclease NurA [Candidatus Micrarchaeota archaeon]